MEIIEFPKKSTPRRAPKREAVTTESITGRRSDLGDHDKDHWEVDAEGAPRDPWQFTNYLILRDIDNGEIYTFAKSSKGGLGAVGELCKAYGKAMRQWPNHRPVIEFDVGSYQHRDRSLGRIKFPILKIVLWVAKDSSPGDGTPAAAEPPKPSSPTGKAAAAAAKPAAKKAAPAQPQF